MPVMSPEPESESNRTNLDVPGSIDVVTSSEANTHDRAPISPGPNRLSLPGQKALPEQEDETSDPPLSPGTQFQNQISPAIADRVFPIRSAVSVDHTATPAPRKVQADYFTNSARARQASEDHDESHRTRENEAQPKRRESASTQSRNSTFGETASISSLRSGAPTTNPPSSARAPSVASMRSTDETPLITARFKHIVTEEGHSIVTGRQGDTLQRCEDEPIHIPGAVQSFGLLIALEEAQEGKLLVRVVSENAKRLMGYTPAQLFALESFTDILSEEQADNLLDHIDFIRDEDADVAVNGPEVFTLSMRSPARKSQKFWCAVHINDRNPHLVICEFELEDDALNPLVPAGDQTPEPPEDTLSSRPSQEEYDESTMNYSRPLRVLRSARKRKGEAAAMEVFNIMSQVQEQLAAAPNLEKFLKILVGVVKELTGFHRVMVYQFDQSWNGRVVTELVDPRATKDLYKGLNFPASDIPKQARELYKINKVRLLYDRDLQTARLVCRTVEDLETPLDMTYAYLRAMSPIHLKYLANMAVRSSMSISINAFGELWGLIACHTYGSKGMRVSFPIRKMCRLVGDSASRNIERLSYASRLQARKLINTVPTQNNPSGYIIASSEDLLKLFDADFGLLSIRDETKILGKLEHSQEALAMLEYLRMRSVTNVMTSIDIRDDFPDLRYSPGFKDIAGLLIVPLSVSGQDFIVFFRKGQLKEIKWAGNPYEKYIKEGTEGYLEPRKSFKTWSETVVGKCREWTEEEIETAAVLCLVYGKFIDVWRQKEAALQSSQLTRLLLANSAHEVRTPLNAIINYLEIALEGALDSETRENLAKSHSASKSLIYVINDLLDLTKTEEGGELVKKDEVLDLTATLAEATDMFRGDARRKKITYEVVNHPGIPGKVIGDQRRIRQAISNVTANAIQNTTEGGVKVDMYVTSRTDSHVEIEVSVSDTGVGMTAKKLDALFQELEQVQTEPESVLTDPIMGVTPKALPESPSKEDSRALGLGLAVVARIVRNMNGQLRLKSEEGKGTRFVIQFPFDLPEGEPKQQAIDAGESSVGSATPHGESASGSPGPTTPPNEGMRTLVERDSAPRRASLDGNRQTVARKNSSGSVGSKHSLNSLMSNLSVRSDKSEADRLIDAISEPHQVENWHAHRGSGSRGTSSSAHARPKLEKRHTADTSELAQGTHSSSTGSVPQSTTVRPGDYKVVDQGTPIKAVRILDDFAGASPGERPGTAPGLPSTPSVETPAKPSQSSPPSRGPLNANKMHVLVAEDDPVNSRIIKKRLEKLQHDVHLTVNGEECAGTYCDQSGFFDIVLMDMQMPIVDGLTSTKMIRSHEKSHPSHALSERASLNGRVPVIAVSASLREQDRQIYIDAGFDGWILKPISFTRLSEITEGIVDEQVRKENLYHPGSWERGGWFEDSRHDRFAANTRPSERPPQAAPQSQPTQGVVRAAAADDPFVKEEDESTQSKEQQRLGASQQDTQNVSPGSDTTDTTVRGSDAP